jgi:alkylated DNA repair dioxygenase AlkB
MFGLSQNILTFDGEVYFFPQFLEQKEADNYYRIFKNEINWQLYHIKLFGKVLPQPRLTAWHGDDEANYTYSGLSLKPEPFSNELNQLKEKLKTIGSDHYNSVLLNLYRNQQDSMGWHADDEPELGDKPVIASISLGATRKFQLKHKTKTHANLNLMLTHGSLLLMKGVTQTYWKHAIPKSTKPCGERINLTFRHIKGTSL